MGLIGAVGLVLHPERDCADSMALVGAWAKSRRVQVFGLAGDLARIDGPAVAVEPEQLAERTDLVVSLGGDGTMLRAMRLVCDSTVPVLGVNLGRLGFLAEIDPPELAGALSAIDE